MIKFSSDAAETSSSTLNTAEIDGTNWLILLGCHTVMVDLSQSSHMLHSVAKKISFKHTHLFYLNSRIFLATAAQTVARSTKQSAVTDLGTPRISRLHKLTRISPLLIN